MLKCFEVKNYKNFKDKITINFDKVGGYQFSTDCITDQMISKMLIYGRNATGKTNLGNALFDIKYNLFALLIGKNLGKFYSNADSSNNIAEFKYVFQFQDDEITYQYKKYNEMKLYDEELLLNGKRCFYYNFDDNTSDLKNVNLIGADTVNLARYGESMRDIYVHSINDITFPFLKWLISNTILPEDSVVRKMVSFIANMDNMTISTMAVQGAEDFYQFLEDESVLNDFEDFLNRMGIECSLELIKLPDGRSELYFSHDQLVPFFASASSGTKSLFYLYHRLYQLRNSSLLYIDEFDAFYHYEMSEKVMKYFKMHYPRCQVIMTTHNTNLMTNQLMRPDCLFILSRMGTLTPLCDATPRELREGHNLEKMYISGEFEKYE